MDQTTTQQFVLFVKNSRLTWGDRKLIRIEIKPATVGTSRLTIGLLAGHRRQQGSHGFTAIAQLNLHPQGRLGGVDGDPVHGPDPTVLPRSLGPGSHHHPVGGGLQADDMEGFTPGDPKTATLTHGEVLNPIVLADHRAVGKNDLTLPWRQVSIQKSPHRTMVVGQTEIHAFRFLSGPQPKGCRLGAGFGLTHFPEGKNEARQDLLGQVVEEITLVLMTIQAPQKLMPFAALLSMA